MAKPQRDSKGRFVKGNTQGISTEVAREYQARSAEARKRNRTLAEAVRAALEKKATEGSPMTRLEYLAEKAIANHATGDMTFKDLRDLQKLLGEDVQNVNLSGEARIVVASQEEADKLRNIGELG